MTMFSFGNNVFIVALLLVAKSRSITATSMIPVTSSDQLIDDESHDPFKNPCEFHSGEYYRDYTMKVVCCANDTLKIPDELVHDKVGNKMYADCTKEFKSDATSDLPTGMWTAFLCKLGKAKAFKTADKPTFEELSAFLTKFYPDKIKTELKKLTKKCKAIDSSKDKNHIKIQKYMECYYKAENTICHKPFGEIDDDDHKEDVKKTKKLGCPVVPGLAFESSIEYCCKKRSTPYPIMEFPGYDMFTEKQWKDVDNCRESFSKKEMELKPEAFQVSTPKTDDDDGEDHEMHSTWDVMCDMACIIEQKNYTKEMLKLEPDRIIEFFTQDFGKAVHDGLSAIIKRRKNKEKLFLAMDTDSEKSKPMNFPELSAKFAKAPEKDQIQYFCKFVNIILFEERRALHEYCFDEKYGNQWGDDHHPFFVPEE